MLSNKFYTLHYQQCHGIQFTVLTTQVRFMPPLSFFLNAIFGGVLFNLQDMKCAD